MSVVSVGDSGASEKVLIYSSGMLTSSGAVVSGAVLVSGGNDSMVVLSGGLAAGVAVSSGAFLSVADGGLANAVDLKAGGVLNGFAFANDYSWTVVGEGDVVIGSQLWMDGNVLNVDSDGVLTRVKVYSGGEMQVFNSGAVNSTTIYADGSMVVSLDGVANNTVLNTGAVQMLLSGGTANNTTVRQDASLIVENGGMANGAGVSAGGKVIASGGGTVNNTVVYDSGKLLVSSLANVNNATVKGKNAEVWVMDGGRAAYTAVSSGVLLLQGGSANYTTVYSGGVLAVEDAAKATNNTLNSGAEAVVSSGGLIRNITLESGASLTVENGGTAGGSWKIESGASVNFAAGGILDFTVAGRIPAEGYLVSDLSLISGTPVYTITVSDTNQSIGAYKLAQGAAGFSGSITIGNSSATFGQISVGAAPLIYGDYNYLLRLSDGNLTLTVSPGDVVIPGTVTNLTVTHTSTHGTVKLSWKKAADDIDVTSYRILVDGNEYTSKTTSITVSGLGAGSHVFRVYALNGDKASSGPSDGKVFTIADVTAPSRVTGLSAAGATNKLATLTWKVAADDVGTTEYWAYVDGKKYVTSTNSISFKGFSIGSHTLQVYALDAAGNKSAASGKLTFKVTDGYAPSKVTGIKVASGASSKSAKLSWKKSTDNVKVTGYQVYIDGKLYKTVTGTSLSVTGLKPGTRSVVVYAVDAAKNKSTASAAYKFKVADKTAPAKVTGIKVASGASSKSAKLSWKAASDNAKTTSYQVYINGKLYKTVTGTSLTISDLKVGTCSAVIYALDAAKNKSAASATYKFKVADKTAPAKVTGIKAASGASTKSTKLSWKAPKDNVKVTSYQVYLDGKLYKTVTGTSLTISGLKAGTRSVVVYALDAAKNKSTASAAYKFKVADKTAPAKVTGIKAASGASTKSAKLSWKAASDNVKTTSYQVYINGKLYKTVAGTSLTISDLKVGTCSAVIYALDAAKNKSAASAAYKFKVADKTAPAKVTGIKAASGASTKSAKLSWKAPKDNVKVTSYQVYLDGKLYKTVTGTSLTISGLKAGTRSVVIYALDAAKNKSAASAAYKFKVADATAPAKVTGLTAKLGSSSTTATLSWKAASDNVKTTSYQVYLDGKLYKTVTGTSVSVSGLSDKPHSFSVFAVDAAKNKSAASAAYKFTMAALTETALAAKRNTANNSMAEATEAGGRTLTGYVDAKDTVDWYKFEITEADSYAFGVSQCSGAVKTSLREADGDIIDVQTLAAGSSNQEMIRDLAAGTYYFSVEKNSSASDYTVNFPEMEDRLLKESKLA